MGLLLGDSQRYTDGKVLGSDVGINQGLSDIRVLGNILRSVDGITLGHIVGTEVGYLDEFFDGYNDGNLEG